MRLALAQINPTVGDVAGNLARILDFARRARQAGADLVAFPEQVLLGYPAKDFLLRADLIEANETALARLAESLPAGIAAVVGFAERRRDGAPGRALYNAAALLRGGKIETVWRKRLLPTYDVFDEARYFEPAQECQPVAEVQGLPLGVTICEDVLDEPILGRTLYNAHPEQDLVRDGARLIINISASPYVLGKPAWRQQLVARAAADCGTTIALVNQVGGNDELIFDGGSVIVGPDGRALAEAAVFEEQLLTADVSPTGAATAVDPAFAQRPTGIAELHDALVLGLRDYARKCGFSSVVIGLSGGIDSALVACLAVAALGRENVLAAAMPSRFSSDHSLADARLLAENLGIRLSLLPIEPLHTAAESVLRAEFAGRPADVTEENIQARARGMLLMALSNKLGALLLTTGNKSELAVGYCTLYGDMCGGLAVISDVPKTTVYALARHVNQRAGRPLIPESTLTKPPSAELRPDQTDQQTLPPYEQLDAILRMYEEELHTPNEIIAAGHDAATVRRVIAMIHRSEYKRQQAAPGLKVTSRAFGFGRRMPIAARPAADLGRQAEHP